MQEFINDWGYPGVFLTIIASGLGLPIPEELPIVAAGAMATHDNIFWWLMLPTCILGVIIGDSFLYLIGRYWGSKLIQLPFIRRKLLTPERFASIAENFQKFGVKILLFARLTPGIRTPIFLTAGITKLPLTHFLIADGIYAIPGVSLLFFLGYWFTDSMIDFIMKADNARPIIVMVALTGITLYLIYRFWRKPIVTGNPKEMPPLVSQVTQTLEGVAGTVADKVLHRHPKSVPLPNLSLSDPDRPHANDGPTPAKNDDPVAGSS